MDAKQVEAALESANKVMSTFVPMIGLVGGMARTMVGIARAAGVPTATFEAEIVAFDAEVADLGNAIAEHRAKYGRATSKPGDLSGEVPTGSTGG